MHLVGFICKTVFCTCVLPFTANSTHFPQQCKVVSITNEVGLFSLWGMNWSFMCNLYWRRFSKRFRLLMHCIRAVRSVGLSFAVLISLDHPAGTQTELAVPSYPPCKAWHLLCTRADELCLDRCMRTRFWISSVMVRHFPTLLPMDHASVSVAMAL